jgi:hypothetical protein
MGVSAKDLGGPRREWLRECNKAIKEKYFDLGLRDLLSEEYFYVGILIGTYLSSTRWAITNVYTT